MNDAEKAALAAKEQADAAYVAEARAKGTDQLIGLLSEPERSAARAVVEGELKSPDLDGTTVLGGDSQTEDFRATAASYRAQRGIWAEKLGTAIRHREITGQWPQSTPGLHACLEQLVRCQRGAERYERRAERVLSAERARDREEAAAREAKEPLADKVARLSKQLADLTASASKGSGP